MVNALIRRLVVAFSLLALVGTGVAAPMAAAQPDMAMASQAMADDGSMPCCPHKALSCVTDLGCVFLVGIPTPSGLASTALSWSTFTYTVSHDVGEGLTLQPALGPPILPA
jgi:hypothetical protein